MIWRRIGMAIALSALGTAIGHVPLSSLDAHLANQGLFPDPVPGTGLDPILAAGLLALGLRSGRLRAIIAGLSASGLALIGTWGMRYLVGLTHGASLATVMATGTPDQSRFLLVQWAVAGAACAIGFGVASLRPGRARDWVLQGALVLAAMGVADGIVRSLDVDSQVMNKALYYQTVEIEVHEPSDDPELLYVLKPGARLGGEGPWGIRNVRINSLGARSPEYTAEKPDGIHRTLFFGGSTLYGAGVGNHHTTPARLQALLGRDHEVWNFGACAYNTAQSTHLAAQKIRTLEPDLILLLITNTGRRAFMGGPMHQDLDKAAYFSSNPFLYLENFPPTGLGEDTHLLLMRLSALYRTFTAWARVYTDPDTTYADQADRRLLEALEAAASTAGVPVVYVLSPSRGSEIGPLDFGVDAKRWIDLNIPGRGGDYTQAHPSPAILAEYASTIHTSLLQRGFLEGPSAASAAP